MSWFSFSDGSNFPSWSGLLVFYGAFQAHIELLGQWDPLDRSRILDWLDFKSRLDSLDRLTFLVWFVVFATAALVRIFRSALALCSHPSYRTLWASLALCTYWTTNTNFQNKMTEKRKIKMCWNTHVKHHVLSCEDLLVNGKTQKPDLVTAQIIKSVVCSIFVSGFSQGSQTLGRLNF